MTESLDFPNFLRTSASKNLIGGGCGPLREVEGIKKIGAVNSQAPPERRARRELHLPPTALLC